MKDVLTIRPLEKEYMPKIIEERHKVMETLRTPYMLNSRMQNDYYENVLSNRESHTRYWAFYNQLDQFIGMGGVENISWENSNAEISVLIFSEYRKKGYGELAVNIILNQAFSYLNLCNVWGECYTCANISFWKKMIDKYQADFTYLLRRKYYSGRYWDSLYFTFQKEKFNR